MNYGLRPNLIEEILGLRYLPRIPYTDGDWEAYLPKYEAQAENWESCGCTVWGTQNGIETFLKRVEGVEHNFSERYNILLRDIGCPGADPRTMLNSVIEDGLVETKDFPSPDDRAAFYSKDDLTGSLKAKGINWALNYDFEWKELWWGKRPLNWRDLIAEHLKFSPILISVSAWHRTDDGYDSVVPNNHWCMAYKIENEHIWVFDSYDNSKKKLSKNHIINYAVWFHVTMLFRGGLVRQRSVLQRILSLLFMENTLLEVCESFIGMDASPNDNAPDELGCAETVSTIVNKKYKDFPIITGTWTLNSYLSNPKNGWVRVDNPMPEDIVISPTGLGRKGTNGHTGFVLNNGIIASNDSRSGKFIKNFTIEVWKDYYGKLGYPTYFYRKI